MGVASPVVVFGYGTLTDDNVDRSTGSVEVSKPREREPQQQPSPNLRVYGEALDDLRARKREAMARLGLPGTRVLTDEVLIAALGRVADRHRAELDNAIIAELRHREVEL